MQPDSPFPDDARRLVRVIRFVLQHFWFIMTFLGGVVVCCALASFLEVCLARPQALTVSILFTLVAWVMIFVLAMLRQWDWDHRNDAPTTQDPHAEC